MKRTGSKWGKSFLNYLFVFHWFYTISFGYGNPQTFADYSLCAIAMSNNEMHFYCGSHMPKDFEKYIRSVGVSHVSNEDMLNLRAWLCFLNLTYKEIGFLY